VSTKKKGEAYFKILVNKLVIYMSANITKLRTNITKEYSLRV